MAKQTKIKKAYKRSTNYPVGDFLIRIKNTGLACKREVVMQKTKLVKSVADALKKEGYLHEVTENDGKITVRLAYRRKEPVLLDLKLISKPGLRIYMGVDELEKIKRPSIFILSTPRGVMSSADAIRKRVGGEVLVEVW